jgi:hypothetical protein
MPDEVPLDLSAERRVDPGRFLDVILPDDFNTGGYGFLDFLRPSCLGGGYQ